MNKTSDVNPTPIEGVVMPFPGLRGNSLPSDRYGAWIVQRVTAGWVHLMFADLTATLRIPIHRFKRWVLV